MEKKMGKVEKMDKVLRKGCEKQGLSLQGDDVFVIYNATWVGVDLQFRDGVLVNHRQEAYANPRVSLTMPIQSSGK